MPEEIMLNKTEVTISGYNRNEPIVFTSLMLNEALLSVNHFSFSINAGDDNATLDSIIDFKKAVLGKEVQILFKDKNNSTNHSFKGIVLEVNSSLSDKYYYEFHISGSGVFCTINKDLECHSYYRKTLSAIVDKAIEKSKLKDSVTKSIVFSKELHYTVQYNQSLFSFLTTLALRFGEWMYYDGAKLQIGKKPSGKKEELFSPGDITNLNIHSHVMKNTPGEVGTDMFKGTTFTASQNQAVTDNPFIQASFSGGDKALERKSKSFLPNGFNQDMADAMYKLEQLAGFASSTTITAGTQNNKLSIGSIICIKDKQNSAGRNFIITQIQHSSMKATLYRNSFTAVPLEVEVPPYTNPRIVPKAMPQIGTVTDNEDNAGFARVRVKFPWMTGEDEKSPWISVMVPHAGKGKGFRFLPEKDEEVMVDFVDANAESPYVIGAVYTEKNKPEIPEGGNDVKIIGTRSGRRLEIDDKKGLLKIYDNHNKDTPMNGIMMERSDEDFGILSTSRHTDKDYAAVTIKGKHGLLLKGVSNGEELVTIEMDINKKKIKISSKGSMDIHADGTMNISATEVNMKAKDINLDASNKVLINGSNGIDATGLNVNVKADVDLNMEGSAKAQLAGAMLGLKGSGVASLEAALVKIN